MVPERRVNGRGDQSPDPLLSAGQSVAGGELTVPEPLQVIDGAFSGTDGKATRRAADEALRVLMTRHVVREYTDEPVTDAELDVLMQAMLAAPTASNRQAWAFVAVRERRMRRLLRAFAPGIIGLPSLIVAACFDRSRAARPEESERGGWDEGLLCVAMAVQNLLLASHALGLGGCPVASVRKDPVGALLGLPPHLEPVLVVPIGHPARPLEPSRRRDASEVIRHDVWSR